jgi:hypothetical protein
MALASRLQATATRLISTYGEAVTLRHYGDPVIASGGGSATRTETDYSTYMVPESFDVTQIDGTVVTSSDFIALISGGTLAVQPEAGDALYQGDPDASSTKKYRVVNVLSTRVEGSDVIYQLHVRG